MAKALLLLFVLMIYFSANVRQCICTFGTYEANTGKAVSKLVDGCTRFSFELLRILSANQTIGQEPRDLFFSPYSVWSSLVVTYMGARGTTKQEMKQVLGIGDASKTKTWRTFESIRNRNPYKHYEREKDSFKSASRIYFQKGTTLKKYIRKMLHKNVAFVNFHNHSESRKIINTWVEKYTHRMIKDLIPRDSIDNMTKMVIANAVYFKESWLLPFDPQKTTRRRFTTSSGDIFVTMMTTKDMFLHGESKELQCSILDIPYSDNRISMIILLPKNMLKGVNYLVDNLTPMSLRNLHESMLPKEVMVSIPKFKLEDTHELSAALKKMGLKKLFDSKRVNLSGFTGSRKLILDSVRHKAMIDVNEVGTEAAASTDMFLFRNAGPRGHVDFIADHPFIYFIQDNISNAILFLGTIHKPSEFGSD